MSKERQKITEEDSRAIIDAWYAEAKTQTVDTISAFIKKLTTAYDHDYGTICHACAAGAIAGLYAVEKSPQGGITGFQAGAIQWEIIWAWGAFGSKDAPMAFVDYTNLLYPQYADKFRSITPSTLKWAKEQAAKNIAENPDAHEAVMAHWKFVADGGIPFGLEVRNG